MGYSSEDAGSRRVKIFKARKSLFDHLNDTNPYINGFYKACKVHLMFFTIFMVLRDSYRFGSFHIECSKFFILTGGTQDWLLFACLEFTQLLLFLFLYVVFQVWVKLRSYLGFVADGLYLVFFLAYMCGSFYMVWHTVHAYHMPSIPTVISFIEQLRLCMKSYSYIRENVPKVLYPWHKDDEYGPAVWYEGQMSPHVGSFSQYFYFLFAPTLLYRDHYPRNPVNWWNVASYALQFVLFLHLSKVLFLNVLFPKSMKLDDLVESYLSLLIVTPFFSVLANLLVLHAWFNFTAEVTGFADREFYLNWWSAVGYPEYYRRWNVPVHDFLNHHVYQELRLLLGNRSLAGLPAIMFSALAHDFFIAVSMGFYFPVFVLLFAAIGGSLLVFRIKFSKLLTFMLTCVGLIIFLSFYYTEITARFYCPQDDLGYITFRTQHCFRKNNPQLFSELLNSTSTV